MKTSLATPTICSQCFVFFFLFEILLQLRVYVGEIPSLLHMKEVMQLALNIHSSSFSCGKKVILRQFAHNGTMLDAACSHQSGKATEGELQQAGKS